MDLISQPKQPRGAGGAQARPAVVAGQGRRPLPARGPEGIRAALEAGHLPESLLVTERAAARHAGLVNLARQRGAQVTLVAEPVLSAPGRHHHPQGLVAVLPSVLRPLADLPRSPAWSACWPRSATRATPAPSCARPTPSGPAPWSRPGGRSTPRAPRRSGPPPAACSTCRWSPGSPGRSWPPPCARRGLRLVGADPHAEATHRPGPARRAGGPGPRQRGPRAARRGRRRPRPGRRGSRWPAGPRASTWPRPRPSCCTRRPASGARAGDDRWPIARPTWSCCPTRWWWSTPRAGSSTPTRPPSAWPGPAGTS